MPVPTTTSRSARATAGRRRARTAAIGTTMLLAASLAPPHAVAGSKDLSLGNGTISARGAAVRVPLTFTCNEGWQAFVGIQVVEAVGEPFAAGFGGAERTCTGKKQKVTFYVQAAAGQDLRPFREGPASAVATLDAVDPTSFCDEFGGPCEVEAAPAAAPPEADGGDLLSEPAVAAADGPGSVRREIRGTIRLRDR